MPTKVGVIAPSSSHSQSARPRRVQYRRALGGGERVPGYRNPGCLNPGSPLQPDSASPHWSSRCRCGVQTRASLVAPETQIVRGDNFLMGSGVAAFRAGARFGQEKSAGSREFTQGFTQT